jgi:hypothetical protein
MRSVHWTCLFVIIKTYSFTYQGIANAARVNIIGTFQRGYNQTVLLQTVR